MNIIDKLIIENEESLILRNETSLVRFFESGNGDIYISAISKNKDYDFYISDELVNSNIVSMVLNLLEMIKSDSDLKLYHRKESQIELFKHGIFNWKSDEWNEEEKFNTMQIKKYQNGIVLSIKKNIENKDNHSFATVAFNTNRGHNKLVSIMFAQLLWDLCNNTTKKDNPQTNLLKNKSKK